MRFILLPLLALVLMPASAAVYKWMEEDGTVQYSDQPHEGAEKIELPKGSIYSPTQLRQTRPKPAPTDTPDTTRYDSLSIVSPTNDQTVRSNEGKVDVSLLLQPTLRQGHKFRLYLDGKVMGEDFASTRLNLHSLDRGTHTLQAEVRNDKGEVLVSASPVVFHLRKAAIALQ